MKLQPIKLWKELDAICKNGTCGKETGRFALTTAKGAELCVSADKDSVRANAQDLVYVDIAIADKNGVLNIAADRKVTITVEGAGTLQGFGNADPRSTENFFDTTRTTFHGKAKAVVRAGNSAGVIKVTVSADGCEDKTVEITVA